MERYVCDEGEGKRHGWIHQTAAVLLEHTDDWRHCQPRAQSCPEQPRVRRAGWSVDDDVISDVIKAAVPVDGRVKLDARQQERGDKLGANVAPEIPTKYLHHDNYVSHSLHQVLF